MKALKQAIKQVFTFHWKPGSDLIVLAVSWLLVVGTLYTATKIVTPEAGGGGPYFLLYAGLMATVFGMGIPLLWTVIIKKRPLSDLGLTWRRWRLSLLIQAVLTAVLYVIGPDLEAESFKTLLPLIALSLAIGFFEAVFWRGWVLNTLERSFGVIPAVLAGSLLYSVYHVGYGMTADEMVFLFFIGIMFAVVFKLTGSILILWPFFQPLGQLINISKDLDLPLLATVGFGEALIVMIAMVWLAGKYYRKHQIKKAVVRPRLELNEIAA